eukprot:jgi/Chlat1/7550/Chrsp63S07078
MSSRPRTFGSWLAVAEFPARLEFSRTFGKERARRSSHLHALGLNSIVLPVATRGNCEALASFALSDSATPTPTPPHHLFNPAAHLLCAYRRRDAHNDENDNDRSDRDCSPKTPASRARFLPRI